MMSSLSERATNLRGKPQTHIRDEDFFLFRDLLQERYGLRFPDNRRSELEHGIRQAFAASTCSSLTEFYCLVSNREIGGVEINLLVNAVTVNETHFFRDEAQFDALYNHILPRLIERKKKIRNIRIWSAGCASGEEPYSIAMLLRDLIPDIEQWSIMILATDINTASLERARQGLYSDWAFREARAKHYRNRYFSQVDNRYALAVEIKRMVEFQPLNLVHPDYPSYETNTLMMDLILCRNVTIYFNEAVTKWIVNRFYDALTDEGWLLVGHSEPSIETYRQFQVRNFPNTIAYQRVGSNQLSRQSWRPHSFKTGRLVLPQVVPPIPQPPLIQSDDRKKKTLDKLFPKDPLLIPAESDLRQSQDLLYQARELMEFSRSMEACEILLPVVQSQPEAESCALLGQAYANQGKLLEAEKWCRQAIQCDRLCLDAYYTLALVLQHQELFNEALKQMKKVVYLDHNDVLGHYGLAHLHQMNGDKSQAMKSSDNALRILRTLPDDTVVLRSQGITVGSMRQVIAKQQQTWTIDT